MSHLASPIGAAPGHLEAHDNNLLLSSRRTEEQQHVSPGPMMGNVSRAGVVRLYGVGALCMMTSSCVVHRATCPLLYWAEPCFAANTAHPFAMSFSLIGFILWVKNRYED